MIIEAALAAGLSCAQLPGIDGNVDDLDRQAVAQVLEAEPDCGKAHLTLGRMTYASETVDESIDHLEAAAERMPPNSELQRMLGEIYLMRAGMESSLGDARRGRKRLRKAVDIDPMNLDARESLAGFLAGAPWIAGGDMGEADEQAEFIREHDAERGVRVLAQNRLADDETEDAVALLEAALSEHPDWDSLVVPLGIGYQELEQYAKAFEVLESYAGRPETDPMVVYQLGRTAALSGENLVEGRAAMTRYIEMRAADEDLAVPLAPAWWRLGMIESLGGDTEAAREAFEKALEFNPDFEPAREALQAL
ncbi:tetratricopeptide repeat protein [Wenzhouxiangella sediminis]|uniref:Tetratricopeptide repeat protein n=1 Tax=Wenzhouxiangella sediminis TaxID=1792836 RepID=A0A3E1K9X2_9GAMM|nr:tetratricopeptide repeat protein [Wenzhouxiangella sediminis]RFF31041.1 tetratricopeptide repeat protein [Wenzhouxiangella sediminis]